MAFRWNIFFTYLPILAQTSVVTFQVVGLSVLFSAVLGLGLAMLRMSKNKVVSGIARVYGTVVPIGNGHYRFSRGYHFLA